jgi:hypothetical protein
MVDTNFFRYLSDRAFLPDYLSDDLLNVLHGVQFNTVPFSCQALFYSIILIKVQNSSSSVLVPSPLANPELLSHGSGPSQQSSHGECQLHETAKNRSFQAGRLRIQLIEKDLAISPTYSISSFTLPTSSPVTTPCPHLHSIAAHPPLDLVAFLFGRSANG